MCHTNLTKLDWTKNDQLGSAVAAQSVQYFMSFSTTDIAEGRMTVDALNRAHVQRNASGYWHRQPEDHIPIPNARNLDILKEDIVNGLRQDKEDLRNALVTSAPAMNAISHQHQALQPRPTSILRALRRSDRAMPMPGTSARPGTIGRFRNGLPQRPTPGPDRRCDFLRRRG